MTAGPAVASPNAKSVYTPTTGERYVNPSEKLLHSPSARVSCCLYPNDASCAASARICSDSIRPPSGSPGTLGDTATLQRASPADNTPAGVLPYRNTGTTDIERPYLPDELARKIRALLDA